MHTYTGVSFANLWRTMTNIFRGSFSRGDFKQCENFFHFVTTIHWIVEIHHLEETFEYMYTYSWL